MKLSKPADFIGMLLIVLLAALIAQTVVTIIRVPHYKPSCVIVVVGKGTHPAVTSCP